MNCCQTTVSGKHNQVFQLFLLVMRRFIEICDQFVVFTLSEQYSITECIHRLISISIYETYRYFMDNWPLKLTPLCCLEASGKSHSMTQRHTPEEGRLQVTDSRKVQHQRVVQDVAPANDVVTSL